MIQRLGQVMLYVNDQEKSLKFWTEQLGFSVLIDQVDENNIRLIEVVPSGSLGTSIVIHDKKIVEKMSPGLHLGTPSLLFFADDIQALYQDMISKNITVGELVTLPMGRVFNFSDEEDNYFAVIEK